MDDMVRVLNSFGKSAQKVAEATKLNAMIETRQFKGFSVLAWHTMEKQLQ